MSRVEISSEDFSQDCKPDRANPMPAGNFGRKQRRGGTSSCHNFQGGFALFRQ